MALYLLIADSVTYQWFLTWGKFTARGKFHLRRG